MSESRIIQVDETVARAMRDESLDGRVCLLEDLRGGVHAREVISEITAGERAGRRGEHSVCCGDLEMRLEAVVPAAGFYHLYQEYDKDEVDSDEFVNWRLDRFAQHRVMYKPRQTTLLMPGLAFKSSERLMQRGEERRNSSLPPTV